MNEINFLIILGGGVDSNEKLTPHSKLRHDLGVELEKKFDYIICSSYKTYKPKADNQIKSEALVGKEYLIENSIISQKILIEEISKDTFSNAFYSRELIEKILNENNFKIGTIGIITSKFHMDKTKLLFKIVFPTEIFRLQFYESENGNINPDELKNRIISENILIKFYKKHLIYTYKITPGDMNSIRNFMENFNSAMTGNKDKYHLELTAEIEKKLNIINPLY